VGFWKALFFFSILRTIAPDRAMNWKRYGR